MPRRNKGHTTAKSERSGNISVCLTSESSAFDLESGLRSAISCESREVDDDIEGSEEQVLDECALPQTAVDSEDDLHDDVDDLPSVDNAGSSHKRRLQKKKTSGHLARKRARLEQRERALGEVYAESSVRPAISSRYTDADPQIRCNAATEKARVAHTAFVALNDKKKEKRVYTLDEVTGEGSELGFELKKWDGSTPMLIVDKSNRIVAVLAGWPDDEDWERVHREAAQALESQRACCSIPQGGLKHRRGAFPALRCGVSHGGGQKQPMNLKNKPSNQIVIDKLNNMSCFKRIAGFGSNVMKHRAPKVHRHYVQKLGCLHRAYPTLKRPFASSVFSAATYNLGPQTLCYKHKDFANLPFGWCAVTALGDFDYTQGGHLILWDCEIVVEFPPGATILLPSAIIAHSNVSIAAGEHRYSFAQYSAGGLFRWVENGMHRAQDYRGSLSQEELELQDKLDAQRWALGLSLWPTVDPA